MGFEYITAIADATTDNARFAFIGLVTGAFGWIGMYMVKPWFADHLEGRKQLREARIKREDALAEVQIAEARQRTVDRKAMDDKLYEGLVRQGRDDQSIINLLGVVASKEDIQEVRDVLNDIYNKMGVGRNERYKPVQPVSATGEPPSGESV